MSSQLHVNNDDPLLPTHSKFNDDHTTPDEATTSCICRRSVIIALIAIIMGQLATIVYLIIAHGSASSSANDYQPGPYTPPGEPYECCPLPPSLLSPSVREFVSVPIVDYIVMRHVRVIDGNGSAPIDNQMVTINVTSGKIASIVNDEPAAEATIPKGAHIMDLSGGTVMPGMVGMHEHLFYPSPLPGIYVEQSLSAPRLYLSGGVTSMRTSGSINGYTDINTARFIDRGLQVGPHIHATAPYIDGPGNPLPSIHKIESELDARRHVDFWSNAGATSFKAYMWIGKRELTAAISAAHARGLKVTGHLCSIGFMEAAEIGIDHLEHGLFVDTEFDPSKQADVCPSQVETFMTVASLNISSDAVQRSLGVLVSHNIGVVSTLAVIDSGIPGHAPLDNITLDAMLPESRQAYIAQVAAIAKANSTLYASVLAKQMEWEREFVRKGGLLMSGADPTGFGGVIAGLADQHQLQLLVTAGFTPLEAIKISTYNGAVGLGVAHCTGRIAPGMNADIIVIGDGDPSVTISDIKRMTVVFKDGIGYDPVKLRTSVKGYTGWL